MFRKSIIIGFLGLGLFSKAMASGPKGIFYGSVQFPNSLEMVPNLRVYYAGNIITCEPNEGTKQQSFSISEQRNRSFFYMLVATAGDIEFCSPDNTIPYLRLKKDRPYKFYTLELTMSPSTSKKRKLNDPGFEYVWNTKEIDLVSITGGKIPDDTIIIGYHPAYVKGFEGGSMVEFPKLVIKPNAAKLAGSEAKLYEQSDKWFLAALNTDTIHGTPKSELRFNPQSKTILAMSI